jgi:hypothetical protein
MVPGRTVTILPSTSIDLPSELPGVVDDTVWLVVLVGSGKTVVTPNDDG